MRLVAVIPAYNASRTLAGVTWRLGSELGDEQDRICIVDDGSTDDTCSVAMDLAHADSRVEVIRRAANGGYGAAMKDGLAAARRCGADVVACVHADGQYAPEVLGRLIRTMQRQQLDLVQGSRIASGTALAGGMPLYKYAANRALTLLGNTTFGMRMTDYFSGYLVYGARALAELPFARLSNSFDFDLEVIAAARARGLRIGEAPIPTHYGDEISYLRPIRYGLRVLWVMWRFRQRAYDADAS